MHRNLSPSSHRDCDASGGDNTTFNKVSYSFWPFKILLLYE